MGKDILKRALRGDKFKDIFIADSHCHMGGWYNYYFPKADIDEMADDAKAMDVDKIFISPHGAISVDYKLGNEQIREAVEKYPHRVYGYLTLNANYLDEIEDQLDKYYSNKNFIGIKLHPALHNYKITGSRSMELFEKVKDSGGIILTHSWEGQTCNVDMCEEIIRSYPHVPLVLAHAGGTGAGVEKSINVINKYENAYLDTSGFEFSNIWLEDIIKKADYKKIFFGSDFPFHDIRGGLSRVLFANVKDSIKVDILGNNFMEAIKKYPVMTAL